MLEGLPILSLAIWVPIAFGIAVLAIADYASIAASARNEWYSVLASGNNSALYPALSGSIDLARPGGVRTGALSAAVVHGRDNFNGHHVH